MSSLLQVVNIKRLKYPCLLLFWHDPLPFSCCFVKGAYSVNFSSPISISFSRLRSTVQNTLFYISYCTFSYIYCRGQRDGAAIILSRTSSVNCQMMKVYLDNVIFLKPCQFHILVPGRFTRLFQRAQYIQLFQGFLLHHCTACSYKK